MAEATSATERAAANVIRPPATQANKEPTGDPACSSTMLGLRKMPLPMIMPTTIAKAWTNDSVRF